ncbi:hypothetical protein V6N12_049780 [Hibiscus sabdariffa]|uniref:Uncharacterized protein n=1 Tax=Hibiscus sabdariffa TaxID=183260 RepID=A0ABR2GAQ1_9ROSI
MCGAEVESIDHILRFYPDAYSLWCSLIRAEFMHEFFQVPLKEWILANITNSWRFARDCAAWDLLFGYLLWLLWNRCNARVFDSGNVSREPILVQGKWLLQECLSSRTSLCLQSL